MKRALIAKGQIIPPSPGDEVTVAAIFCGGKTKWTAAERMELALKQGVQGTAGKRVPSGIETKKGFWLIFHADTESYKEARQLAPNAEFYPAEAAIRAALLSSEVSLPAIVVERAGEDLMCVSLDEDGKPGPSMLIAPTSDDLERFFRTCQEEDKIWPSTVVFSFEPTGLTDFPDIKEANVVTVGESVTIKGLELLPKSSQLMLAEERAGLRREKASLVRKRSIMMAACLTVLLLSSAMLMSFWSSQNESEAQSYLAKAQNLNRLTLKREVKIFWDRLEANSRLYASPLQTVFDNLPPRWRLYSFSGNSNEMRLLLGPVPGDELIPEEKVLLKKGLDKIKSRYKMLPFKNGYQVVITLPRTEGS
jgi:hypothetical protein